MKTKEYLNPKKAYDFINSWTQIKTVYEVQFSGKKVDKVEIIFEGNKPRFASVYYTTSTSRGISSIDLSTKILLDKPDKENIASKVLSKK